jgi:hypothetical protein
VDRGGAGHGRLTHHVCKLKSFYYYVSLSKIFRVVQIFHRVSNCIALVVQFAFARCESRTRKTICNLRSFLFPISVKIIYAKNYFLLLERLYYDGSQCIILSGDTGDLLPCSQ